MPRDRLGWDVLAAVALGGAVGSAGRYGLSLLVENGDGVPWATFAVNIVGCLLIGMLMEALTNAQTRAAHRLVRPFLATGVLGGFTTFSTYAVDIVTLVDAGRAGLAVSYLFGTLALALFATWLGGALVALRWRPVAPSIE